ncbi:leucine-rich repeat protein [Agathobaculum hominis]
MKKILWLLAAVSAAVIALALPASAADYTDESGVTLSYETTDDNTIKITGIRVDDTAEAPVDVTIPGTIDGNPVTEINLEASGAVPAEKVKSIQFEDENNVPVIYGNLFAWKNTKTITIDTNRFSNLENSTVPNTDAFLNSIPAYITSNYNYDSNSDGTNDTYYVGNSLVRVDTEYSGDITVKDGTVSILAGAFEGCSKIEAVTLPGSIEWIGVFAFADSSVTSVNIPEALMTNSSTIQYAAFYNCTQLKTVTLEGDENLNKIGYLAFYGCSGLTAFDFTRVNTIDTLSFYGAFDPGADVAIDLTKTAISNAAAPFSHSGVKNVTFGIDFRNIPFEAFYKSALTDIVWAGEAQGNLENMIGAWAFAECEGITADVLKDSNVKYLSYRAFANTSMTELTIPSSVTTMAGGVFAGIETLKTVNWDTVNWDNGQLRKAPLFAVLNDCSQSQYSYAYYYMWDKFSSPSGEKPAEYTFPTTLNIVKMPVQTGQTQSDVLFGLQPYLETVNFRDQTATSVPAYAFQFCPNLKKVTFAAPEKITSIGGYAFLGCLSLKEFPFTELTSLNSIGQYAFLLNGSMYLCSKTAYQNLTDEQKTFGLTAIDLSKCPAELSIGEAAFYNQYNAVSVHISDGAKAGWAAFNGTASATEFICDGDLPVSFFAKNMFAGGNGFHDSLEKVTIGGQITGQSENITQPLFFRMNALKTVSMPNATSVGSNTFLECGNLETVSLEKATSVGMYGFFQCTIKSLSMPELTTIGEMGFLESTLSEVNMPKLTTVGNRAFLGSGFTSVTIHSGVTYGDYAFAKSPNLQTVVVEEGVTELSDFMFADCDKLTQVSLPSTLEKINWAAFKKSSGDSKIGMIEIPASVTKIEDDAFSNACDSFILRGKPEIEAVHEGYPASGGYSPIQAIDGTAVLYAASMEDAQRVLDTYKAAFRSAGYPDGTNYSIPAARSLPDVKNITLTGAPSQVDVGSALDLSGFKVTYGGQELTAEQYTLNYSAEDTTLGDRVVTVTITDKTLEKQSSLVASTVRALSFKGENAQGTVYSVNTDSEYPSTTFTVKVVPPKVNVTGVQLSRDSATVYVNDTLQLTATVLPEDATDRSVRWSSSDESIASVDQDGKVTALAAGTATITVTTTDGGKTAGCIVTVTAKSSGGSSSGGSSSPSYPISTPTKTDNGTVSVSPRSAEKGDTVTITVKPDSGYQLEDLTVTDKSGNKLKLTDKGNGKYTFTMPASKVEINATFVKEVETSPFNDVSTTAYYYEAVKWAQEKGITGGIGNGLFGPNQPCTRAQIVTFLWRAAGSPEPKNAGSFTDVSADSYYAKAVAWAVENGITGGTGDGKFSPDATCTRAQSVTFLYRALGTAPTTVNGFTDVAADAFYADAVAWAVESGVTNGTTDSTFSPSNGCTRAQIVTFLYRAYQGK